jgi:predicted MFS family arabinose efflux permease
VGDVTKPSTASVWCRIVPAWLVALLVTVFVFYTDDYVIAGVLPEIAEGLAVSEAQAGQLVAVFSLMVALNTSGTYLGGAIGGGLGGILRAAEGPGVLPPASGVLGVAALFLLPLAIRAAQSGSALGQEA